MSRFKVDFNGVMDRLEELERENHRLIAERDARHQQVVWRNARIDELQTMIDAMRLVVEAVAAAFIDHGNGRRDVNVYRLFPVALIEQARAFVAAHPRASESAGGDDERDEG